MAEPFDAAFATLLDATDDERPALARTMIRHPTPWATWRQAFDAAYGTRPEAEAAAALALAIAAGRARRTHLAARFRLLAGRGQQRAGSPAVAGRTLARASRDLTDHGDRLLALQADILRIDALAHAGRPGPALALADATRRRLRGPTMAAWRAAVDVNRANALRLRGDARDAVGVYETAARNLTRLGDPAAAAIALSNAGTAWLDVGDARRARQRLEAAGQTLEAAGLSDMAVETEGNLAAAEALDGELGRGIRRLQAVADRLRARGLVRRAALATADLADAYWRAGDHGEAERKALEAAEAFRRERALAERAEALWLAAAVAPDRQRSRSHVARAARAARRADRPGLLLRCDLLRARARADAGRRPAPSTLASLRCRAEALGLEEAALECRVLQGRAALTAGRAAEAAAAFSAPGFRRGGRPWQRIAAEVGRAEAESLAGDRRRAIRRLRRACSFLDAVRGALPGTWLRTTFLLERLDPYLTRVALLLDAGRPADRLEAEAVLEALALRRVLESGPPARSDALAPLRARLETLYDRLARGSGSRRGASDADLASLAREASGLERKIADRWKHRDRRRRRGLHVDTAGPVSGPLAERRTALHVWRHRGEVWGLIRRGDRVLAHARLASAEGLTRTLARLAFDANRATRGRAGQQALGESLANLRRVLLGPLASESWSEHIGIAQDPTLPDVPWEALVHLGPLADRPRHLVRVPAFGYRPRRPRSGRGITLIALGDPDLPAVTREIAGIQGRARVHEGRAARRAALRRALATSDTVHVAGHGFEAANAPGLGGVRLADGWFGAEDLPPHVAARLVILAACRTGRAAGAQAQAWGGLPLRLLTRGARRVLWTADDVDDEATADLMERFHDRLREPSTAEAFRDALRDTATAHGHAGRLLPFRLSGIDS